MDSPEPIERDIAFFAITGASVTFRKEACQCNLQSRRWLSLDAEEYRSLQSDYEIRHKVDQRPPRSPPWHPEP
jgi:hypothetical protein